MKLTKDQVTEKREELCRVLVAMNRQKAKAENIKKDLADDFARNEKQYRNAPQKAQLSEGRLRSNGEAAHKRPRGVVTAAGVLYRKPRFEVTAKEKLEVGE